MKKIAAFAMLVLAAALTFTACSAEKSEKTPAQKKVSIVATIYPQYDWLRILQPSQAPTWSCMWAANRTNGLKRP